MERMTTDAADASGPRLTVGVDAARAAALHARAAALRWHVPVDAFKAALERSASRRFERPPTSSQLETFLDGLHLEDLALAVGCAEGIEVAWDAFMARHRAELVRAAAAIAGGTEGDEIVDALLVDLFARGESQSARRSLFDYFHGRSRLSTWLRALIAQRHVDRLRASRRLSSLDDEDSSEVPLVDRAVLPDPDRARLVDALQAALDEALAAVPVRDRLRLAYYHGDGLTLAAIGRLLNEHEATVSRKLQRTRDRLRAHVDQRLTAQLGLDQAQLRECYEHAIEDGGVELGRLRLVTPDPGG